MLTDAKSQIRRNTRIAIGVWVLVVGFSLWWNVYNAQEQMLATAEKEAKGYLKQDLAFRRWATSHGGLYVPVDGNTKPSPFLSSVAERDVTTPSGRVLTLQNPATSLREIKETQRELYGTLARITGMKYLNPDNAPDVWEQKALGIVAQSFEDYGEVTEIDGKPYLRMMQPMVMEQGCLACHAWTGIRVGELRGGTDISIPLKPYQLLLNKTQWSLTASHTAFLLLGLAFISFISSRSMRFATAQNEYLERLSLYEKIFESSSEGMLVTNENNEIISVNTAFTDITGYSLDEVKGRNPRLFSSGRHDRAFYQTMWHELLTRGHWQGEVWDKHKDGELHAKYLAINTLRNPDGSIHRYVALFSDITERKQSEELIWKQANFDTLTELPNRRMFLDRLAMDVEMSRLSGLPMALLLIDLDQFKEVNDTLGHGVGDKLLKEAAFRIRSCVRTSDTVARLGGDEFVVILPELADTIHVEDIAQKIIDKLAEHFVLGNEVIFVSASVGITLYPADAGNIEDLMKNADQAMYEAKKNGRNRFSYYTHSLQEAAQKRLRLTSDLRSALANNQFKVYFQPIIDLASGRIHKAEALLRWQHSERGMVSPLDFIPIAEESGMIHEIGDWVFKESGHWAKRWSSQYADDFQISVNKSPVQFRSDGRGYSSSWLGHLQELGLPGKHIVVEITEGLLLHAEAEVTDRLLTFRDAGIQVAIDDFGTGYSSLSYLKKFDIDYLKIDQSFVRNLTIDSNDMALCEAIIVMAHKLGLQVIAEGVETEEQRNLLVRAGCDFAQGYLFSRPVPPEDFERLLAAATSANQLAGV